MKFLQAKDLTVGNSYYAIIDEAMGGYPSGVVKVNLKSTVDEQKIVNRYMGVGVGCKDLLLPVNSSHFQIEEIIYDLEDYYTGKETYTFDDEEETAKDYMSYIPSTEENLTWIKENTDFEL
jgi:hypothetical protein